MSEKTPELLSKLFEEEYGIVPLIKKIKGGGSSREYNRLWHPEVSVIGAFGDDVYENEVFFKLDEFLEKEGIKVPHVINVAKDRKTYLLQDLGDTVLLDLLKKDEGKAFVKKALQDLTKIQTLNPSLWEKLIGYPDFGKRLVRWDLNYFKYDFLKPSGVKFDEDKLEDDFDRLVKVLSDPTIEKGLMYRDFQSRNIMVKDDELWYLDFQGARKGPLVYDASSFIWQAKAPFSYDEREELSKYYVDLIADKTGIKTEILLTQLETMVLFRTLQVLGAYGFRGLIEKKPHFFESIPFAIANLQYLKEKGILEPYHELKRISESLTLKYEKRKEADGLLTLTVFSFSYKQGYPEDGSGNGGGFMFDCRAIHNPGKYKEYVDLTGMDASVIEFLEKTGEAQEFVRNAIAIVSPSIKRYKKRGFTSLQVGFGCTGGQHRSVYCAELFSKLVSELFPDLRIKVVHRERGMDKIINRI